MAERNNEATRLWEIQASRALESGLLYRTQVRETISH